jgi:hypothetical protein
MRGIVSLWDYDLIFYWSALVASIFVGVLGKTLPLLVWFQWCNIHPS